MKLRSILALVAAAILISWPASAQWVQPRWWQVFDPPTSASYSFLGLNDVATTTGHANKVWSLDANRVPGWNFVSSVSTFLGLSDTPESYASESGKFLSVTIGETGMYFDDPPELPGIASRAGSVLRVKDDESGVEWWEARDYAASFSTFVISLATDSVMLFSSLASASRSDVILIENRCAFQGDWITWGPASWSVGELYSGGHQLNKNGRFTARIATDGFDFSIMSSHERIGTATISVFWGAR